MDTTTIVVATEAVTMDIVISIAIIIIIPIIIFITTVITTITIHEITNQITPPYSVCLKREGGKILASKPFTMNFYRNTLNKAVNDAVLHNDPKEERPEEKREKEERPDDTNKNTS